MFGKIKAHFAKVAWKSRIQIHVASAMYQLHHLSAADARAESMKVCWACDGLMEMAYAQGYDHRDIAQEVYEAWAVVQPAPAFECGTID